MWLASMFSCWIAQAMMKSAKSTSPVYQTPSPVLVPVLLVLSAAATMPPRLTMSVMPLPSAVADSPAFVPVPCQ